MAKVRLLYFASLREATGQEVEVVDSAAPDLAALYAEAASQLKVSVPKSPMRSSKLMDGVAWDGSDPARYADAFKVKA